MALISRLERRGVAGDVPAGSKFSLPVGILIAASSVACGPAGFGADEDAVAEASAGVMNGALTSDEINIGLSPPLWWPTIACSSTLVRNDMILTAGHCFHIPPNGAGCETGCAPPDFAPETVRAIQHRTQNSADDVIIFGAPLGHQQHASMDIAIMKLASPFSVNGSTLGHSVPLWGGAEANLNAHVGVYSHSHRGYGRNDCVVNDTLRSWGDALEADATAGYNPATGLTDTTVMGYAVEDNRIADNGDSGSSFRWNSSAFGAFNDWPILGVANYENSTVGCPGAIYAKKVPQFRSWVHQWLAGYSTTFTELYDVSPLGSYTLWGGSWSVSGGNLIQTGATSTSAIDNRVAISNALVRAKVYSADNNGKAGLYARLRDSYTYYHASFSESPAEVKIVRMFNGASTTLGTAAFSVDWGTTPTIEFRVHGKNLQARVNGTVRLNVNDTVDATAGWLTAGKVGVTSVGMDSPNVQYRELSVVPINTVEP